MIISNSTRRCHALTWFEVLVIVCVVAVMAALLFPALSKAKTKHKRIGCLNSLKQVGVASGIWCGEHAGKFPMQISLTNGGTMELISAGSPLPHFQVMSNELNTPRILWCPEDAGRSEARSFETNLARANVSYFVGVDADAVRPATLLAGDDHLMIDGVSLKAGLAQLWATASVSWRRGRHSFGGNICLVDGSVQSASDKQLRQALTKSGLTTNRLAMP